MIFADFSFLLECIFFQIISSVFPLYTNAKPYCCGCLMEAVAVRAGGAVQAGWHPRSLAGHPIITAHFLPCILPSLHSFTSHNHGSSAGIR